MTRKIIKYFHCNVISLITFQNYIAIKRKFSPNNTIIKSLCVGLDIPYLLRIPLGRHWHIYDVVSLFIVSTILTFYVQKINKCQVSCCIPINTHKDDS